MVRRLSREIRRLAVASALAGAALGVSACGREEPDLVEGKRAFVAKCGSCHVLERAGTKGVTGPNLDEAFQQAQREGFGESAIEGVVYAQIRWPWRGTTRPCEPDCVKMPADLVEGDRARDVAAYVAEVVSKGGKDSGLLAEAVKAAGSGKPIAAEGGVLTIDADPSGQLLYVSNQATAEAGELTLRSPNKSTVPHNIVIDGKGEGEVVQGGGVSEFKANFTAGEYEFYCSVEGHKAAGMTGKLTVK